MSKKGYFYINGYLVSNELKELIGDTYIQLDNQYIYEILNFGVSQTFDSCRAGAINDIYSDLVTGIRKIPNTYIAIFEIELSEKEFNSIDNSVMIADFDILEKILDNKDKLVFSGMYDDNANYKENFIKLK